ncbi:MAG TPA: DUF423 domain-containing protein [Nitrospirales bacterium]|nr:DUF423 domain-containing protein [Nitrospirales bacterium]
MKTAGNMSPIDDPKRESGHQKQGWLIHDNCIYLFTVYQTAVQYQFYHALGLLGVGLLAHQFPTQTLIKWAGWFMFAGIVIFSGSLYTLSLTSTRWLGAITPIGGASFIVSWILLIVSIVRQR